MIFNLFIYLIIIISAVFHEFMHGYAANYLGDPTAKNAGRLTLNPFKHMDFFGTVLLPLFVMWLGGGFLGYAKPVPYNPYNLRDRKFGSTKVAFAGPAANFLIALFFGLLLRLLDFQNVFFIPFSWITYINLFLAFFNLIPIPPLDGSKLLMDLFPDLRFLISRFVFGGIFLAVILAVFLLPYISGLFYFIITGSNFIAVRF
jgi:Zn-dependent protease